MEASPLAQQTRPSSFRAKIVDLYEDLFFDRENASLTEGFWQEFFLLKPDLAELRNILKDVSPESLLDNQTKSQQIVIRAVDTIGVGGTQARIHALDTLTVFLESVLSKRYTNPSSDIIAVLAGLHDADAVFQDLAAVLEHSIRAGSETSIKLKAVRTVLTMVVGVYSTSLVSYFIHRDLFPAIIRLIADCDVAENNNEPVMLLGLLTNYNKFEFQNPYRLRLGDLVNEAAVRNVILCIGAFCLKYRNQYVALQDDAPEGWTIASTLNYVRLGHLALRPTNRTTPLTPEEVTARFTSLPGLDSPILLTMFDFVDTNRLFCSNVMSMASENRQDPSPSSSFLSFTSYLFQHAHRSIRSSYYAYLCLYILQILLGDEALIRYVCDDESQSVVRLCRQRQPFLPYVKGKRTQAAIIMDIMVDCINHNLRKRLDTDLHTLCIGVLTQVVAYLGRTKTRIRYHWSELWRSLLSFVRFLTLYSTEVKELPGASHLASSVVSLIALSLSTGESFLSETAAYDDLFYKLVEVGSMLPKFKAEFGLHHKATSDAADTLISVSQHYQSLLHGPEKSPIRSKTLTPREVHRIIQEGYETLSLSAYEHLEDFSAFREVEHKNNLKRLAKIATGDSRTLLEQAV